MKLYILTEYDYPDSSVVGLYFKKENGEADKNRLEKDAEEREESVRFYLNEIITKD